MSTSYSNNNLPDDFDPLVYKSLHNDLIHLDNNELTNHFINNGMNEGRLYKHNQIKYPPSYLEEILNKLNIDIN